MMQGIWAEERGMVMQRAYRALADRVGAEELQEEGMLQHLLAVLCLDPCRLLSRGVHVGQ